MWPIRQPAFADGTNRHSVIDMRGIHQYKPRHFSRIAIVVNAHDEAAEGSAHQYEGRRDAGVVEQMVEVVGDGFGVAGKGTGIAPAVTGAVVPAGAREVRNVTLNMRPAQPWSAGAALEDHCGRAFARTGNVQRPVSNIDARADARRQRMEPFANVLVKEAGGRGGERSDRGPSCDGFRALCESRFGRGIDDIDVSLQAAVNAIVAEIERGDFLRFDGFKLKPLVGICRESSPFAARENGHYAQSSEQHNRPRRRLQ